MFFVIWRGWGILAAVFVVVGFFVGAFVAGAVRAVPGLGGGVGVILSAVPIWLVGRRLNSGAGDRVLVDPSTGQHVVLQRRHTLFWIPMQWWAIGALLLGLILSAGSLAPTPSQ
ncbi:MAG TPA: hypothetical protein VMV82_06925 [Candidatus Dormibacteraeota bacterium]|nr:hypothetical protein [Candidatus Dormibacteraeota bacterium]